MRIEFFWHNESDHTCRRRAALPTVWYCSLALVALH
jgi:hypothetical protein